MKRERNPKSPITHHKSSKLKALENDQFLYFPEEIITKILSRLPVKSIVKFRCVSKSWLSISSSKRFIKNHLDISRNDSNVDAYRVILSIYNPKWMLKQCAVGPLFYEQISTSSNALDIDYPMKNSDNVWVEGSCNGLICIRIRKHDPDIFLWNPATKESMKLPSLDITRKTYYDFSYGFGFDESNDDYKVVTIYCLYGREMRNKSIVNIYSLKTDSWKRIKNFKSKSLISNTGKFASGKLHWQAKSGVRSTDKWDIVSLDLGTELYGLVEQPKYEEGKFCSTIGVLGGCICVLVHYEISRLDLWILKEYGVKESWSKMFSFTDTLLVGKLNRTNPVCMLPDGEILLVCWKYFVVCNPRYNSVRLIQINNLDEICKPFFYVESLVSPVANGRLQSQATLVMEVKVVDEVLA